MTSFYCRLLEATIALALFQHIGNSNRYNLRSSSSFLKLVFAHGDDVSQVTFLRSLRRSDHVLMLFKFMVEMTCQTVAPAHPNIWSHKDLKVTVSHDLRTTAHCREVAAKRFRTLWALRQPFTKLDTTMFTTVYSTSLRTKLENCVQVRE